MWARGRVLRRVPRPAWGMLVVMLVAPCTARADGWNLYLEPGYAHDDVETTDEAGKTTRAASDRLLQNYRLTLDKHVFDNLAFSATGSFQGTRAWTSTERLTRFTDNHVRSLFTNLVLTTPVVVSGLSYGRSERTSHPASPTMIGNAYSGFGSWRPLDLPELDVRLSRDDVYDTDHRVQDVSTSSVIVNARYAIGRLQLRSASSWINPNDRITQSEYSSLDQSVQATYGDVFGRTSIYASALLDARSLSSRFVGDAAKVTRLQAPVAGLSTVEAFPAIPQRDTLSPNPALVDGNTTESASVDIGFGRSEAGDRNLRDLGGQFGDLVTDVNTLHLWVDRTLPADIVQALSFAVYASDDNVTWSAVVVAGSPTFGTFQDRVEITIATTRARYLKVVVAPLAVAATTNATFREILVTELQFLLVLPASAVPRTQSSYSALATATARTVILRRPNLDHDVSVQVERRTDPGITLYSVVNGLSYSQRLRPQLVLSARASREDQDAGSGHRALWQWSAALTARPLPTLQGTAAYSGTANETEGTLTQSLSIFGRADWYEGVSSQATAALSASRRQDGSTSTGGLASASTTVTPNRIVTFTGAGTYSTGITTASSSATSSTSRFARVDGSVSFTPAPALSAVGSVSRIFLGAPNTLASALVNYSPLRGDLQLSVGYSRTLDTASDQTVQTIAPALRWYATRAVSLVATYTIVDSEAPVQTISARTFLTTLRVKL